MKKILKNFLLAGVFVFFVASPVATVVLPQTAYAAVTDCNEKLLGVIPPWYRGLTQDNPPACDMKSPDDFNTNGEKNGLSNYIWRIVLNVIEMALVVVSIIAVFFILYGGFLYLTSGGNSAQTEKARKSIFNAVIGLVISMGAIAITNLIFGLLDGAASSTNEFGVIELTAKDLLRNGLNLAYYIAGIIAVVVIIIAGIMYVTSMGDSGRVTRSKNMILYAVIGLVVILVAFAITNFVLGAF
ncbi:MAG: pilin [Candidatus Microsaccharimonas sp.]